MYSLFLKRSAEKDLDKIKNADLIRIIKAIEELESNPRNIHVKKLTGRADEYRLRVGSYRILFYIQESEKEIKISRIVHRKEAYK